MSRHYQPDMTAGLPALRKRWEGCTDCTLGAHREQRKADVAGTKRKPPDQVFGSGLPNGVMVIGPSPSWREERDGNHLAQGKYNHGTKQYDPSGGTLVRSIFERLQMPNVYYTGLTLCRACEPSKNEDGTPRTFPDDQTGKLLPQYKDRLPLFPEVDACKARLLEEIYYVDPLVVVALGPEVALRLVNRRITDYGKLRDITIPRRTPSPRVGKKGWVRKYKGELIFGTEVKTLTYPLMVVMDPEEVLRKQANRGPYAELPTFYRHFQLIHDLVVGHQREIGFTEGDTNVCED